ncbi:hypothetical protein O6H91_11G055400 [Diphasiastrum complanatum]|uniref:Uncharacterized protein n=1 Tax=Diphasiastrum complanatum TaxID=34168 RepID=A0ACC2C972_DIPCM|nr:hypothetical protein O6H91_11G055400 [Diphasiastrum complanatum]
MVFGRSIYDSRYRIGQILAEVSPMDCDVVIAVPDSGMVAALGYAATTSIPFQQGLITSHYVCRTFIEPSQRIRDFDVKLKLAPVHHVLKGKRVAPHCSWHHIIEDRAGDKAGMCKGSAYADFKSTDHRLLLPWSRYFSQERISHRLNVEESREFIDVDSLAFLPLERLRGMHLL